jgi:hypothetical protein
MILVNESRQSYMQHIEMKEAALTACKNEFHSLTKQVERASAEKVTGSSHSLYSSHANLHMMFLDILYHLFLRRIRMTEFL